MSQYREGTVNLTGGSATVTLVGGDAAANITIGNWFIVTSNVTGAFVQYTVAATPSGAGSFSLTAPWPSANGSQTGVNYVIQRDFSASGLAILDGGEAAFPTLYNRNNQIMEGLASGGGPGGTLGNLAFLNTIDWTTHVDDSTPNFFAGWDGSGNPVVVAAPGGGGSAPATSAVVITRSNNPYALSAANRSDPNTGVEIHVSDTTNSIIIELAAGLSAPANWTIVRRDAHTGPIYILGATSAVSIDAIAGVGNTHAITNGAWTSTSGNNTTVTGTFPVTLASGQLITWTDHSNANNNGFYITTGTPSASSIPCTKLSGGTPANAAAEAVTLTIRNVAATMAPQRAVGMVKLTETNIARYKGEQIEEGEVFQDLDLNGKAILNFTERAPANPVNITGAVSVDFAQYTFYRATCTGNVTSLAITNMPLFASMRMLIQLGGFTFAFPANTAFTGGTLPTLGTGQIDFVITKTTTTPNYHVRMSGTNINIP